MSIHGKSALIIIGTLLIGVVIGLFAAGPIAHHRMRPPFRDGRPEAFTHMVERLIDPADDQRDAVREILQKHAERLADIDDKYHGDIISMMDSLRTDLDTVLTDEQRARLEERRLHFRQTMRPRHGKPDHFK